MNDRSHRRALLTTLVALVASVFASPTALAQTICDRTEADGFSTLTVNMDADQAVARAVSLVAPSISRTV